MKRTLLAAGRSPGVRFRVSEPRRGEFRKRTEGEWPAANNRTCDNQFRCQTQGLKGRRQRKKRELNAGASASNSPEPIQPTSIEERLDKELPVEGLQIVQALADADHLHRHAQLALERHGDAALGRAV